MHMCVSARIHACEGIRKGEKGFRYYFGHVEVLGKKTAQNRKRGLTFMYVCVSMWACKYARVNVLRVFCGALRLCVYTRACSYYACARIGGAVLALKIAPQVHKMTLR